MTGTQDGPPELVTTPRGTLGAVGRGRRADDAGGPRGSFKRCQGLQGELLQSGSCHHFWQGTRVHVMSKLGYSRGSSQGKS